jgi:hypothetical protein
MNRISRSGFSAIAIILTAPLGLMGCLDCDRCNYVCYESCLDTGLLPLMVFCQVFAGRCMYLLCPSCILATSQDCENDPDKCTAMSENYQAAIQLCNEYPEECQQAFDAWVESLEKEAIK